MIFDYFKMFRIKFLVTAYLIFGGNTLNQIRIFFRKHVPV